MADGSAVPAAPQVKSPPLPQVTPYKALDRLMNGTGIPCEFELPSGEVLRFGSGPPKFRVICRSHRVLERTIDELSFGEAYVKGEIDIEGDMMSLLDLRQHAEKQLRIPPILRFWWELLRRQPTAINRSAVQEHYSYGDDFYLTFVDSRYRLYSHGLFRSAQDTLEQASEQRLESVVEALALQPGMRLLDIGCGWGGVEEYCGQRGVRVAGLTLAKDSYNYLKALIAGQNLPCEALLEDFLAHRPRIPYDGIVILGVIEHIPYYRRFCEQVWNCLRPGGLLYLDASATREKYDVSPFTRRYVYQGTNVHTPLCLHELLEELLYHGFEVLRVRQENEDYHLTTGHWARRLDASREKIVQRWGEPLYRAFRLYLWAGSHAFRNDILQAYQVVARRTSERGPRPGRLRRTMRFLQQLA